MLVAIVGGGLSAPTLALFLKEYGIDSVIYEAREEGAHDAGTITLTANSLRILDSIGMYDPLRGYGGDFEAIHLVTSQYAPITSVLMGSIEKYGYAAKRLPRQIFRDVLLDKAQEVGVKVNYNMKCSSVVENEDGNVTLTFDNGQSASADLAVGADGFYSRLRKHVAPDSAPPDYVGLLNLGGSFPRSEIENTRAESMIPASAFSPRNFFAMMPASPDGSQLTFIATFPYEDLGKDGWNALTNDPKKKKALLEEQFCSEPWPEWLQKVLKRLEPGSVKSWPYHLLPTLPSYLSAQGNVVLVGDAAHGMPPTGAQGANLAVEDAATLAYVLSKSVEGARGNLAERKRLLSKWDVHRQERVRQVVAYTMRGTQMLRTKTSPLTKKVQQWVMWAMYGLWLGEEGGMRWLYDYQMKSVLD